MPDSTTPIPWYQSPVIRASIVGLFPLAVVLAREVFKIDLSGYNAEHVADWAVAAISALGTAFFIYKRVKAGHDPSNPAPPIASPVPQEVKTTINRLTR